MIVFGSRMYGRKNTTKGWGFCDNCGVYGQNTSYNGRKWGHLYYIPLIPAGPRARVVKECKKCSHGIHFSEKDVPNILNDLYASTKKALVALVAGQKEFDDNGTQVSSTSCLLGAVELLHCLQADDHLRLVLSALHEKNLSQPYHLVQGESLAFQGKLDEAISSYSQATEVSPNDPLAYEALGSIYMKKNDAQSARDSYERALKLSDDRWPVLHALLGVYDSLKDDLRLAETYEECFDLVPELLGDKKIFKAYKKACKKAGKQPISK